MMRYGRPGSDLAAYAEEQKKLGRKTDARTVKRVALAFGPYKFQVALVLFAILLTTLLGLVNPILVAHVFDDAILKGNEKLLLIYFAIMIAVPVISGFIGVGQNYLNNKVGQRVMADFRYQLYEHLQSLPLSFFTGNKTGEIQSRLSNDVSGVQGVVTNTVTGLVANLSAVLSTIIAMAVISPLLTLISLGLLPLFIWITYKVGKIRRKMSKETQQSLASLSALMQETLSVSGILLVKVFGQQKYAQAQFRQENEKLTDLALRQLIIGRWFFMFIGVFFAVMPALIYLVAGVQVIQHATLLGGTITLGTIIAFTALQGRLFFPIGQLLSMQVDIQGAFALFDRIFEYLDLPVDIADKPDALHLNSETVSGEVAFRDVTFTYKRDAYSSLTGSKEDKKDKSQNGPRPVLKNISFTIKPGQLAALVGPSGAGKTTITYMVPRLYDVESGAVEIDGVNVKDIAQSSLGELIGVVTQETYLFHASIRENLLYARPAATEDEMIAAARAAAIHERIMQLEDGYDTIVGERGYKLSGGEKQRVAIARVVLKNPRILILDEATSSLDTHSERLVQASLERLMQGRTTLAIAHRLSTILAADIILVVNNGEIIERGTHHELLTLNGLYAQLYNEQFSRPLEAVVAETGQADGLKNMKDIEKVQGTEQAQFIGQAQGTSQRTQGAVPTVTVVGVAPHVVPIFEPQASYPEALGAEFHGDSALSGTFSLEQAVPSFETDTPYLRALEAMLRKTAPPPEKTATQETGEIPALSTRHLSPSVREIFRPSSKKKQDPATEQPRKVGLTWTRLIITAPRTDYREGEKCAVFLEKDLITIGEARSNDIVLDKDHMTAPYHAFLRKQDGDYYLFERLSKGGMFVNGHRLVSGLGFKLADGDQITIGQYCLTFANTPLKGQQKPLEIQRR